MIYSSKDMESRAVLDTAAKICAAARTAPKTRGMDGLVTCVLTGEDKSQLAAQMRNLADELDYAFFNRDADNVDASDAVVLFGMEEVRRGLDAGCQYCHFESCADCTEKDGLCAWDAIDIGIAIGSAALTALALMASYIEKVKEVGAADVTFNDFSLMNPLVLTGLFIGACLPFVFAALTMNSVGRAAQSVVLEVRRQFREIAGLMEGKADPDYARCVDLCTKASLKEMVLPTVIAVVTPIVVGMVLGYKGVVGLLAGATVTGFLMAIYMANAGGAWDNAKKYIEAGNFGGKGGVVGDTVGDPFKDTSGPAINILIKLLSMVSIVFAGLIVNYSIF